MIASVSSGSSPAPLPNPIEAKPFFTTEKIQNIALAFFAFFTLTLGTLAFTAGPFSALFIGVPLYVASGFIVWLILEKDEYEDPEFIKKVQAEAQAHPLQQIIQNHGWENLIRYSILTPEIFLEKYEAMAQYLTYTELLKFYEEAESYIPEESLFSLPPPSEFKEKWLTAMRDSEHWEIVTKFDLPKLVEYGILTLEEKLQCESAREQYIEYKKNYAANESKADETFAHGLSEKVIELEENLGDQWKEACNALKALKFPPRDEDLPNSITACFTPGKTGEETDTVYNARIALSSAYSTLKGARTKSILNEKSALTTMLQDIRVDFLTTSSEEVS